MQVNVEDYYKIIQTRLLIWGINLRKPLNWQVASLWKDYKTIHQMRCKAKWYKINWINQKFIPSPIKFHLLITSTNKPPFTVSYPFCSYSLYQSNEYYTCYLFLIFCCRERESCLQILRRDYSKFIELHMVKRAAYMSWFHVSGNPGRHQWLQSVPACSPL